MGNNKEVPQKKKNRATIWSSSFTSGCTNKWSLSWRDTCTAMFIAILFIITETWKQLKCPSVDREGMIDEYKWNIIQLAITMKEILPFTATCMDLESTVLSEISIRQKKKNTVWFHLHVETKKELNSLEQSRMVIAVGWGWEWKNLEKCWYKQSV